jgi:hypothetical protein
MSALIGALRVSLGLDSASFVKESRRVRSDSDALGDRMERLGNKVGRVGKAVIGAGAALAGSQIIGSLRDMAKEGLELASSLGEQAEQLGVSSGALQRYRFIATQVGIDQEVMDRGLAKVTLTLGKLSTGTEKQRAELEKYGISQAEAARLVKMTAEDALPFLADKYAALKSPTDQAAFSAEFFGSKMGGKFATLLSGGSKGIESLAEAYRKLNIEISPEQIKKADDAMDSLAALAQAQEAQRAKFAVDNADAVLKGEAAWERLKLKGLELASSIVGINDRLEEFSAWVNKTDAQVGISLPQINERFAAFFRDAGAHFMANIKMIRDWGGSIAELARAAPGYIRDMVTGIYNQVVTRLNGYWDQARAKIDAVKGWFFGLYDAVVGHSYIPDMVDGIAAQMLRLDTVMVDKALTTTSKTKAAFQKLGEDLQPIMERLFPEARELADYKKEMAKLDAGIAAGGAGGYTKEQLEAGVRRANGLPDDPNEVTALPELEELGPKVDEFARKVEDLKDKTKISTVAIARSFKDMADETIGAFQRISQAFSGGSFLDKIGAIVGLVTQLGSVGAFGKTIQGRINTPVSTPPIAGARALGGPVLGGRAYLVGERGPELMVPSGNGRIIPNNALGGSRIQVLPSAYFDVAVDGRIVRASPAIADAGATVAGSRSVRAASRRLAA